MPSPLKWFDQQTGLLTTHGEWWSRRIEGGPGWRFVWPATIAFTFVVQAITGLVIWMYYSPGAQAAWESVYYLQYQVLGGWLLRAIHFYGGQAMLILVGLYVVQLVITGGCRPARTVLFWAVLLMGLVTLGLNLTGDLLPWDQNSYWATGIRIAYLSHTPVAGPWLAKLAVGGTQFGTFTLTRFLALHAGVFTAALLGLIVLHAHLSKRARETAQADKSSKSAAKPGAPYWPGQAWRDAAACLVVMAAIMALSLRNGTHAPHAGIELGAPASAVDDPGTARPEWSFRGLYQLHELLAAYPEMVSIMIIPGATLLVFFLMPWIGRNVAGRMLNAVILIAVLGGLGVLTYQTYAHDAKDERFQAAAAAGKEEAERVKELVVQPAPKPAKDSAEPAPAVPRIPAAGARTLLANDPKTQGPKIFSQHCASCHDYSGATSGLTRPEKPTAADLAGFAGREWLTDFMTVSPGDAKGIASARFFGNTKFKHGKMYGFIKETYGGYEADEKKQIVAALSHEAALKSQAEADVQEAASIAAGTKLINENCADCHIFHGEDKRTDAKGPDLTGYGSRAWLIAMIGNPAHKRFYGKANDRMPAFAESSAETEKNLLSQHDMELLADWLRGDWYEPK